MAEAIKSVSIQRGYDVTRYVLNCFGGAGGQHACLVADALGLPTPPRVPKDQLAQYLTPMMLSFLTESRRINGRRALKELRTTLQWPTVETFLTAEKTRRAGGSLSQGPTPRD
jgi:N-methylhydantoinase A/oxoprolinase/acetone carboxylase beta subunit